MEKSYTHINAAENFLQVRFGEFYKVLLTNETNNIIKKLKFRL